MTVYFNKDRNRWCYTFELAGERFASYAREIDGTPCASKRASLRAEGRERERAAIGPKTPRADDYTLAQAFADLAPAWARQDDWTNKQRYIRELLDFFGRDTPIGAVDAPRIRAYVEFARSQPLRLWAGGPKRDPSDPKHARFWKTQAKTRAPATVNLYLKLLGQAVQHAAGVIDQITGQPALRHAPKVPAIAVPKRKARPVPEAVLSELLRTVPEHIVDAIVLTLYFGFRRGEMFTLQIQDVDLDAGGVRLEAGDVKDHEDAFIPGAPAAMEYLQRLAEQARGRGTTFLITWRRYRKDPAAQALVPWRPISSPKRAWSTAMKAIEQQFGRRWRWHDIRASFITHVAMTAGAVAAQKMARHSRYETTQGYVEVADEERRIAATRAADRPALQVVRKIP